MNAQEETNTQISKSEPESNNQNDNNMAGGSVTEINNNNATSALTGAGPQVVAAPDAHTREKLFDFIALLQGRRMDDQRAILKPSGTKIWELMPIS